jgi:hypothetical protein
MQKWWFVGLTREGFYINPSLLPPPVSEPVSLAQYLPTTRNAPPHFPPTPARSAATPLPGGQGL